MWMVPTFHPFAWLDLWCCPYIISRQCIRACVTVQQWLILMLMWGGSDVQVMPAFWRYDVYDNDGTNDVYDNDGTNEDGDAMMCILFVGYLNENNTEVVQWWCNGKAFGLAISRSRVQIMLEATLRNNLRQVVYTYVPLSPSSITWYRPKGGDALRLGR